MAGKDRHILVTGGNGTRLWSDNIAAASLAERRRCYAPRSRRRQAPAPLAQQVLKWIVADVWNPVASLRGRARPWCYSHSRGMVADPTQG